MTPSGQLPSAFNPWLRHLPLAGPKLSLGELKESAFYMSISPSTLILFSARP